MSYVIVYGALRSGSTMLRLMLDGHSELSCAGEHDYLFDHLYRQGRRWQYDLEGLRGDRIFVDQRLRLPETTDGELALADLLSQLTEKSGKPRTVLMLHRDLDKAVSLMHDTPIIHLLRDPRDVARSWVVMGWHGNAFRAVEGWMETERLWSTVEKGLAVPNLELRYEALLANPQEELGRVCSLLGIRYEEGMLAYSEATTYDVPDSRFAEQWRRKMPAQDLRLVETRLGDMLTDRGYAPSGEPTLEARGLLLMRLNLQDFVGRWRHLIGRYGLLPVQRGIGRRFNISSLQARAQRRMDEINRRYLR